MREDAGAVWRCRVLAFLFPIALSAPFLRRAFFVDDGYFVEIARWLAVHPDRPYDFRTDDAGIGNAGWERGGIVRMVNPLGHHYFLAALWKLGGGSVALLRFGTVLLTAFAALCVFELGRRFTSHPLAVATLTALSPAWWLTAHSLLIDASMGAFFVAGLYLFIRAAETDSMKLSLAAGLCMAAAVLCKYTALLVLPVSAAWAAFNPRKARRPGVLVAAWLVPLAALCAYSGWTAALYGRPHILAASERMVHQFGWAKLMSLAVFFSGSTLLPLIAWAAASHRGRAAAFALVASLAGVLSSRWGGFTGVQAGLLGLWASTTVLLLWEVWTLRKDELWPRDAFPIAWAVGFLLMMGYVMDWVAVRYFHVVAPALAIIAVRFVEIRWPHHVRRAVGGMAALLFAAGLSLAYADYRQARPGAQIGGTLAEHGFKGGPGRYYLGDSFTVSYLKDYGWTPCFPSTELHPGDLVVSKEVTMPLVWFARLPIAVRPVATFNFGSRFPVKVMDMRGAAGFYASVWGALPFTFSDSPWERFRVLQVVSAEARR